MYQIDNLYEKIKIKFRDDPKSEAALHSEIAKIVSNVYTQALSSDEGYCFKFSLPLTAVSNLYNSTGVTPQETRAAFEADWGSDAMKNH